jgi:hypothetical protein
MTNVPNDLPPIGGGRRSTWLRTCIQRACVARSDGLYPAITTPPDACVAVGETAFNRGLVWYWCPGAAAGGLLRGGLLFRQIMKSLFRLIAVGAALCGLSAGAIAIDAFCPFSSDANL